MPTWASRAPSQLPSAAQPRGSSRESPRAQQAALLFAPLPLCLCLSLYPEGRAGPSPLG